MSVGAVKQLFPETVANELIEGMHNNEWIKAQLASKRLAEVKRYKKRVNANIAKKKAKAAGSVEAAPAPPAKTVVAATAANQDDTASQQSQQSVNNTRRSTRGRPPKAQQQ